MKGMMLPLILLGISLATIVTTLVLLIMGYFFFFFFLPVALCLPWSVKKIRENQRKWNVEDLR